MTLEDIENILEGKKQKPHIKPPNATFDLYFPMVSMILIIFSVSSSFLYVFHERKKNNNEEFTGIITDKYNENRFVIENKTVLIVDIDDYYHYEIGDEYKYKRKQITEKYN